MNRTTMTATTYLVHEIQVYMFTSIIRVLLNFSLSTV
jgi:hypothetical protein